MLGNALYYLHRAFQAFAAWCRCDDDPHPLVKQAESRRAWNRVQAGYRRRIEAARAKHGQVREIERERTERLHKALRGAR